MAEPIHLISNLGKRDHHNQFTLEALGKDCCYKLSIAAIALILYCDLPSHLCDRRSPHRDRFLPQPRSPLTLTAIALPLNHDRSSSFSVIAPPIYVIAPHHHRDRPSLKPRSPSPSRDRSSLSRDRLHHSAISPLISAIALPLNHDRPSPQTRSLLILAAIT